MPENSLSKWTRKSGGRQRGAPFDLAVGPFERIGNRYEEDGAEVRLGPAWSWRMVRPSGTEAPGARRCGQADAHIELRARVSSWPPLRLARLRRERGSVGVVSPAAPVTLADGGGNATCCWKRHPPDLRRGGDLGGRQAQTGRTRGHDAHRPRGSRQELAELRRGGDRSHRQCHGGVAGVVAVRCAGDHRQPAAGEGDCPCPREDRQDRCRRAGEPSCGGVSAGDLDARRRDGTLPASSGAPLPGRAASHPAQERGAGHPACAPDPTMSARGPVQRVRVAGGSPRSPCRATRSPRSSGTSANSITSGKTSISWTRRSRPRHWTTRRSPVS